MGYKRLGLSNEELQTELCVRIDDYCQKQKLYPNWSTIKGHEWDDYVVNIAVNVIDKGINSYNDFCNKFKSALSFLKKYGFTDNIFKDEIIDNIWPCLFDYKRDSNQKEMNVDAKSKTIAEYMRSKLPWYIWVFQNKGAKIFYLIAFFCMLNIFMFSKANCNILKDIEFSAIIGFVFCFLAFYVIGSISLSIGTVILHIFVIALFCLGLLFFTDASLYSEVVPLLVQYFGYSLLYLLQIPFIICNKKYIQGPEWGDTRWNMDL